MSQGLIQQVTALVCRVRVGTSSHNVLACLNVLMSSANKCSTPSLSGTIHFQECTKTSQLSKILRFGSAKEARALLQEERGDFTVLWVQLVEAFWYISLGFSVNSALPHHLAAAHPLSCLRGKLSMSRKLKATCLISLFFQHRNDKYQGRAQENCFKQKLPYKI